MHHWQMRTHSTIVKEAGAPKLAKLRGVSIHTARSWAQRDNIPSEHWQAIAKAKLASLDELAAAAALNVVSPTRKSQTVTQ